MKQKTILILHGWGGQPKNWEKVVKQLKEKKIQVEIPYLPGFDKNQPINKPYTLNDYRQWLLSYLQQKKINKPVLVGHSNGGRIAAYFAAKYSDKIKKLILIASAGIPPKNRIKIFIFKIISKIGKKIFQFIRNEKLFKLAQKIIYKLAGESDYLKASPLMKKTMINLLAIDLTSDLAKIKCPTLIIWGKNDKITPLWIGKKIRQLIKNSQMKIIENGGHGLHFTHPKIIAQFIIDFVFNK